MVTESDNKTTEKVAKAAHEAIDKIAASADQVEARIRQTAAEAQSNIQERADRAQRMSEDVITNVQNYVYEHPLASITMAFAAGIVLSRLLRR